MGFITPPFTEMPDNPEISDDDGLADRIINGDTEAAVDLLCERCGPRLKYLAAVRYKSLGWQFEELISELFLHLQRDNWRALRHFQGRNKEGRDCKLTHYVTLIAGRLMAKKIVRHVSDSARKQPLGKEEEDRLADPQIQKKQTAREIRQAIMLMEKQDRDILILHKLEERGVDEIAALLGISRANVYTRCSRAMERLRALLRREDGIHA